MKVKDVVQVGEKSVSAGTMSFRHQTLHLIARQLLLVALQQPQTVENICNHSMMANYLFITYQSYTRNFMVFPTFQWPESRNW